MFKKLKWIASLFLFVMLTASLAPASALAGAASQGNIVVANRGSGSISVIDARSGTLSQNVMLPQAEGDNFPEPMYVVYTAVGNQVFVGDRANDRVVSFDADDFSVNGAIPAGEGVFHMWADGQGHQLWVNNDGDKTTTVIDPATHSVLATIPTPADLVAQGGFPHDVILDSGGNHAYITVLGNPGDNDYVVQFSTSTFAETGRAAVGKDPHLSLAPGSRNQTLYVPCQGTNNVYLLNRFTMDVMGTLDVPGAHGAGMAANGRYFYTSNLTGGGTDALFTIDTQTNTVIGAPTDAPYAVPHNLALTPVLDKIFLTHSGGTADKVTFYNVSASNPIPVFSGEVTVGLNPFGLSFVP
jgi:YVTN family beta-propeller protein